MPPWDSRHWWWRGIWWPFRRNLWRVPTSRFRHSLCRIFGPHHVSAEKRSHARNITCRKALQAGERLLHVAGEPIDDASTPTLVLLSMHDEPPDIPIELDQLLVDRQTRPELRGPDTQSGLPAIKETYPPSGLIPKHSPPRSEMHGWRRPYCQARDGGRPRHAAHAPLVRAT